MENVQNITIAHIDDDPMMLEMAQLVLEQKENYTVKSFRTGEEFLEGLQKGTYPDIIIVDYHLNSEIGNAMSGVELIEELHNRTIDIPTIVVSAQKDVDVALHLIKLRVVDYIEKSGEFTSKMLTSIEDVLHVKKLNRGIKNTEQVLTKDRRHFSIAFIAFLIGGALMFLLDHLL